MLDPIAKKLRAILTETLPYEVPVIFSNEFLFVSELRKAMLSPAALGFLDGDYRRPLKDDQYTVPFNFQIRKGSQGRNTLSIVHPLQQLKMAEFLFEYSRTIIEECKISERSLRAPFHVLPDVSKDELKRFGKVKKLGLPHVAPDDGKLDINFAPSFFSLRKYNLLDKFYGSNELLRLESRFPLMRKIDVTKCFFNIYTHSITWAVKEKAYSKKHSGKYSFEGRFDTLMQRSNYNETNGIVVGPEISRVFAEIIFQKIDCSVVELMEPSLHEEHDFALRRYVDDFFLFAKNEGVLNQLTGAVEACLEEYKLFPNENKGQTLQRPFVTNITRAKQGIFSIADKLVEEVKKEITENRSEQRDISRNLRNTLEELRLVVRETHSTFCEVSGPIYHVVGKALREVSKISKDMSADGQLDAINRVRGILRILFYSLASDFRVSPVYKAYQAIEELSEFKRHIGPSDAEALDDYLTFEVTELIATYGNDHSSSDVSLEICNLILLGATIKPDLFLAQEAVKEMFDKLLKQKTVGYFTFVGLMYAFGHSSGNHKSSMDKLTRMACKRVIEKKTELRTDSETYLLFSDVLSCPSVEVSKKKKLIEEVLGNTGLSDDDVRSLAKHVAFVDWSTGRTSHFLRRKRLQPVYTAV